MNPTRRDLCQAGLFSAVAFALGGCNEGTSGAPLQATGKPLPADVTASSSYGLVLASFAAHVGSRFTVSDASGERALLTLVAADDLGIGDRPIAERGECFALSFEARGPLLDQDTYRFSHPAIGDFPLFVVPGRPSDRQTYSAIFNRI